MNAWIRSAAENLLRTPPAPGAPPGDEASTRVFRAAPRFYQYLVVVWGLVMALSSLALLPLILIQLLGSRGGGTTPSAGAHLQPLLCVVEIAVLVIIHFFRLIVIQLDFEKRWYVVTDRSLRVREGVVKVSEMTVTFANIQNISISQGPIQRLLGIADLRVDTAGGGSTTPGHSASRSMHTAWFRGVSNGAEVRDLILARVRHLKDAGLGDHEERSKESRTHSDGAITHALRELLAETGSLRKAVEG